MVLRTCEKSFVAACPGFGRGAMLREGWGHGD